MFQKKKQSPKPTEDAQMFSESPATTFEETSIDATSLFSHNSGGLSGTWATNLLKDQTTADGGLNDQERRKAIKLSRRLAVLDPLGRQALRLFDNHALGSGVSVQVGDKTKKGLSPEQQTLVDFMIEPSNAKHMSAVGQRKASQRLQTDGNWFAVLQNTGSEGVKIRRIDPLEVTEIISNPVDRDDVWFYKRESTSSKGKLIIRFYQDISIRDRTFESLLVPVTNEKGELEKDESGKAKMAPFELPAEDGGFLVEGAFVVHTTIDSTGQWGNPRLTTMMVWSHQFSRFMSSRIALQQARVRVAVDEKVTGSKELTAARAAGLRSSLTATNARESNPPPADASTFVHNEGLERTPVDQKTSAPDAKIDGDMLLMMVGIAVGIFPQFFGLEAQRLQTQRSIVGPMMKEFRNYQQILASAYEIIFQYVLEVNGFEDAQIDIDFPPIEERERKKQIEMIKILLEEFPQFRASEELQGLALATVGLNNTEQIIRDAPKVEAIQPPAPVPAEVPPVAASETETLTELIQAFRQAAETVKPTEKAIIQPKEPDYA